MPKSIEKLLFYKEAEPNTYLVGMSAELQDDLGDISFAEFLEKELWEKGKPILSVEATKRVMDILAPVQAKVLLVHEELVKQPELLNSEKKEEHWIAKIEVLSDLDF